MNFGARIWLAFVAPWKMLFDDSYAEAVAAAGQQALPPSSEAPKAEAPPVAETEAQRDLSPALQLLSLLQREGRFVDFLQEDAGSFSDAEIGAAARVVHEGCKRALTEYVSFAPVRDESEGEAVELPAGYDASSVRITGNVVGDPPFRGTLAHHGWRVTQLRLPELTRGKDPSVIAAAEVELG